jgi:membrane fusion protein, multidrug efflux system
LQQAEATLESDEAHLDNAEVNLRRYQTLLKQDSIAQQEAADQASKVSQLKASVASDKAAVFNAKTQLGYTTVTSPISGVTGFRQVDVGNILQPTATTPIVTVTQISSRSPSSSPCRKKTF